ncbi:hypothetical protein FNAPI_9515 [Fusarium napiforme]|uniref:Uncharacterized protein n=1 Tax=Fusarium napiforme TaxID=42672 RepID=A0A8H5IVA8_9HYPO|nr:hypothetical protein FNAPI_9515 [Fusarium napiforme]
MMETVPDLNPTITEILPPEVIILIISCFCSHCSNHIGDDNSAANARVLVALTQTCMYLRSIAMPILFHSPGPHLPSTYFFRVADCQPNLARTVKHLCLPFSTPKGSSIIKDSALFTRFADRLSLDPKWPETATSWVVDDEKSLALALFSGIQRLEIQIEEDEDYGYGRQFDLLYSLLKGGKHQVIFQNLRHLEIDRTDCIDFSICDPEPIFLLGRAPRLQTLIFRGPVVLSEPPYNDSVIQDFCTGVANLTELQIEGLGPFFPGSWQTRALEKILGAAQNLKTFKFVDVCGDICWPEDVPMVSATELLEFLNPRTKKTLQHLRLDLDRVLGRPTCEQRPITPQQIKQFTSLRTLELDPSCYCTRLVRDGVDIEQFMSFDPTSQPQGSTPAITSVFEKETHLVEFLPQTVETLTIVCEARDVSHRYIFTTFFDRMALYGLASDTTLLAQRVVSGEFPNLRRVQVDAPIRCVMHMIDYSDDDLEHQQRVKLSEMEARGEAFRQTFVGSGVETRFETWLVEHKEW